MGVSPVTFCDLIGGHFRFTSEAINCISGNLQRSVHMCLRKETVPYSETSKDLRFCLQTTTVLLVTIRIGDYNDIFRRYFGRGAL